ncbi:hypothetical protein [Hydrogenophaga sp.]|uniref:hypothetical protein n=1 Tax=Hydrogenophaga sp. TaxID=1904254 RepID=UPI00272B3A45|nr:hypothetical protein [Hydrogenophaga sp.]
MAHLFCTEHITSLGISEKLWKARFDSTPPCVVQDGHRQRLFGRLQWLSQTLIRKAYLLGEHYSMGNTYLFVIRGWSKLVGLNLSDFTHPQVLLARVGSHPAVQRTLAFEGMA